VSTSRRRPTTGRSRFAARPEGAYEPEPLVRSAPGSGLEVLFEGEDGRNDVFRFADWPMPHLHPPLAEAFAVVCGPQGSCRTRSTAEGAWSALKQFLRSLKRMAQPPAALAELTARHLDRYRMDRLGSVNERTLTLEIWQIRKVLREVRPPELISEEVHAWLNRRRPLTTPKPPPPSGYSDREFDLIMATARSDVAAIRERLATGRRLLTDYEHDPDSLDVEQQKLAATLAQIRVTGEVPIIRMPHPNSGLRDRAAMLELAGYLFLLDRDIPPLLTLAVGLSGRNAETIKDLSADHEVLEGKAVRVGLVKRRRGPSRMFDTGHWEIGKPSARLQTSGGLYLLIEEMTRLGRSFSGTDSLWSIWVWRNGHIGAYDRRLHRGNSFKKWQARHQHNLIDDNGDRLRINLPLLKKTVDVRNTRAAGGHLPSSTRSNTFPVLFSNYLRGDASVREWAGEVVTAALADAERDARAAHARVLATAQGQLPEPAEAAHRLGVSQETAEHLLAGRLDTVVAACADIEHGPFDGGKRCSVSFLTCLACENALVTHAHIPRLKALLDWLLTRREAMELATWWQRHGLTWLAITQHIRPKFSPAEWDQAPPTVGLAALLDVIDGPKENT